MDIKNINAMWLWWDIYGRSIARIQLVPFHYLLPHLCGNQLSYWKQYQLNIIIFVNKYKMQTNLYVKFQDTEGEELIYEIADVYSCYFG